MRKQFLLFLLLMLLPSVASAEAVKIGDLWYNLNTTDMSAEVTHGDDTESLTGEVVIPSSVQYNEESYTVTAIGDAAFMECENVTSITIPNSVTIIGGMAFEGCPNLTSIVIPNSVTSLGEYNQEIKGKTNVEIIPVSA